MKLIALLALATLALPVVAEIQAEPAANPSSSPLEAQAAREAALKCLRVVGQRVSWNRASKTVYFSITLQNDDPEHEIAASLAARTIYTRPGMSYGPKVDEKVQSVSIKPGERVTFVGSLAFEAPAGSVARLELPDPVMHPELIRRVAMLAPAE